MSAKTLLIESLNAPFGEDIMEKIRASIIPEFQSIADPSDSESATIAIGKYCANANEFLRVFSGVPLLQFLLMGCSMSPVFHNILLSGLEFVGGVVFDFEIKSPKSGESYKTGKSIFCEIELSEEYSSVTATCQVASQTLSLQRVGEFLYWGANLEGGVEEAGDYTFTFMVSADDKTTQKSITITVSAA